MILYFPESQVWFQIVIDRFSFGFGPGMMLDALMMTMRKTVRLMNVSAPSVGLPQVGQVTWVRARMKN